VSYECHESGHDCLLCVVTVLCVPQENLLDFLQTANPAAALSDDVSEVSHRTPHTLHPTPYTLHPTPYTLHPTPYTLHPTAYTLNLHLSPYTLHPTPYTLHPSTYTLRPTTHTLQPTPYTSSCSGPRRRRGRCGATGAGHSTTTSRSVARYI
jgi:hypothetical protein